MSKKVFKVQVDTNIVRQPKLTAKAFVVWVRLTQLYHGIGQKEELKLLHKKLMEHTGIEENRTFKKMLDELFEHELIIGKIELLPRTKPMIIKINPDAIPSNNKMLFTQLTENAIDKKMIAKVGHVGIRLLYYYKSRINHNSLSTSYCFAAEETIAKEIGVNRKTIIKYNKILEENNFIKIKKHQTERAYYDNGKSEIYGFWKYNNHVYLNADKIDEFVMKNADKIVI